jgi:hypothetical protein
MFNHTQSFATVFFGLILMSIIFISNSYSKSPPKSKFVGMYTQGSVDTIANIFLLDDNTFCYTFMGGSLDLLKAGHWTETQEVGTIHLEESRSDVPIYPAYVKNLDRLGPPMVGINIDGYSISRAAAPVFAVTSTDKQPTTFRPLFPMEDFSWPMTFALPLMPANEAKYLFIGDFELDAYYQPTKRLRMVQYKIGDFDTVRIGFNDIQSDPDISGDAQLINNVLQLNGDSFGSRQPLTADMIAEVRDFCINPILQPEKFAASQEENYEQPSETIELLTPLKSFYLDASVIIGKPIFEIKDESTTTATDSLDDLIEAEKSLLQTAFDSAFGDIKTVNEFLTLAKNITEKKQRIKKHIPLIVNQYARLIVAINQKGKLKVSENIFFDYIENIHPATVDVKYEAMSYSISVIASQGIILDTISKNTKISKLVFDKLLGDNYDMTTHKNGTLIYNLACYYAINNRKIAMLDAIKQARKRGKPSKQFMDDTDFQNYWNDTEFVNAIK